MGKRSWCSKTNSGSVKKKKNKKTEQDKRKKRRDWTHLPLLTQRSLAGICYRKRVFSLLLSFDFCYLLFFKLHISFTINRETPYGSITVSEKLLNLYLH